MSELNILILEDSDDDYFFISRGLSSVTCIKNFTRVFNGVEAISYLENNPLPSMIIMDINMPLMDGHTCVSLIKGRTDWRHIPVVFMSSQDDSSTIKHAYTKHVSSYIVKPSKPNKYKDIFKAFGHYWCGVSRTT